MSGNASLKGLALGVLALFGWVNSVQAVPFSTTFGSEFTFSAGGTASVVNVPVPTTIVGDMTIDLTVIGDLDLTTENLLFALDGVQIGTGTLCNNNTADDPFSLNGDDICSQTSDDFHSGIGTIADSIVTPLIADGLLTLSIDASGNVNPFVDITVPAIKSGVLFPVTSNFAAGFGGTISFQTAAVPEPATLALLGVGLAGFGFGRRRKLNY